MTHVPAFAKHKNTGIFTVGDFIPFYSCITLILTDFMNVMLIHKRHKLRLVFNLKRDTAAHSFL